MKSEMYSVFKRRVAQHFNYPESQFRLWVLVNRQNKTVRPDTHIPENEQTLSVFRALFSLLPLIENVLAPTLCRCRGHPK